MAIRDRCFLTRGVSDSRFCCLSVLCLFSVFGHLLDVSRLTVSSNQWVHDFFCFSEADLFEIFSKHSFETDSEVREGLQSFNQTHHASSATTANQSALDSQAATHRSGIFSATNQQLQTSTTHEQSQSSSTNQHSRNASATNQHSRNASATNQLSRNTLATNEQSSSTALLSVEERSHAVSVAIQQLMQASALKKSPHSGGGGGGGGGGQQTEVKSHVFHDVDVARTEEDTPREARSRVRHLSAGYETRIALMGHDQPPAMASHPSELGDVYNRLVRHPDSRAAPVSATHQRTTTTSTNQSRGFVSMTANEQAEHWHGREDQSAVGERPQWYEKAAWSCVERCSPVFFFSLSLSLP